MSIQSCKDGDTVTDVITIAFTERKLTLKRTVIKETPKRSGSYSPWHCEALTKKENNKINANIPSYTGVGDKIKCFLGDGQIIYADLPSQVKPILKSD